MTVLRRQPLHHRGRPRETVAREQRREDGFRGPLLEGFRQELEQRDAEQGARLHLLSCVEQLHGRDLSFNNLNDLNAARMIVKDFTIPACVIVKHANPCGVAEGKDLIEAYKWRRLAATGAMAALRRRASEGGSYRVHVSLTRVAMWLLSLGSFDKAYAKAIAGTDGPHATVNPTLFTVDTPLGRYQGMDEQVRMSATPRAFQTVLVARGSSRPEWMPRD